jgi:glycosyltransferase involved in cell wall biosynthesis
VHRRDSAALRKRPLRILVAAGEWFPDWKGGNARVATSTARGLAERGHEVTVLAPVSSSAPPTSREGSLTILRILPRGRLPITFTDFAVANWYARRNRSRFDVALGHAEASTSGLLAAKLGAPVVYVYHASAVRELRFDRAHRSLGPRRFAMWALDPALAVFERTAVRRAARVLVLSEFSRSLLATDHPSAQPRVSHVSGGVDVAVFSPNGGVEAARARLGLPVDGPLLVTVRRLEPRMGLENLLAAVARLGHASRPSLAVVGQGSLGAKLRRLADELGIAGHVHFAGRVPEGQLPDWYRAADLFVLPTTAYEGFGIATAEALASGTPVVGTPVGATPELLRPLDPRLVAGGCDPAALADAIVRGLALVDPAFRRRCRAYACDLFDWDRVVDGWEAELVAAATA